MMRQPGVEPGAKAWEASMLPIHHWRHADKKQWRSRVSIPVPADCEPTALPSELHPHFRPKGLLQAMGFEPMPLSRLAPKASALTTRPNLLHRVPTGLQELTKHFETRQRVKTTRFTLLVGAMHALARKHAHRPPKKQEQKKKTKSSPRGDSNPQPPDPKSDALSIAPLGPERLSPLTPNKKRSTTVGFEPTRAKPINLAG